MSNRYYRNDDLELEVCGVLYTVDVHAYGTYSYSPATRIDPEESDFEIDDVEATWSDEDGNVVAETKEMEDALYDYLYESEDWEYDYPEPDDDYYEERAMARWERDLDRCGL